MDNRSTNNDDSKPSEQEVLARLAAIRQQHGTIPRPEWEQALRDLGRENGSIGALRKKVNAVVPAAEPVSKQLVCDEEFLIAMAKAPTVTAFHEKWVAAHYPGLSFPSFNRAMRRSLPAPLLALVQPGKRGIESFRDTIMCGLYCADAFGEGWQVDVHELDFRAVPDGSGYRYPTRLKMILILDDATRLVVGWQIVAVGPGRDVRGEDIAAVLIGAVLRYGIPDQLLCDNGKENDNATLRALCQKLRISQRFAERYRGEGKGKIERIFKTFDTWLAMRYPTWKAGAPSSARYSLQGNSDNHAPRFHQVRADLTEMVDRYNRRPHRSLGCKVSPLAAWQADGRQLRQADVRAMLRFAPIALGQDKRRLHTVQATGVQHDGAYYIDMGLDSPGGGGRSGAEAMLSHRLARKPSLQVREVPGAYSPGKDGRLRADRVGLYDAGDNFVAIAKRMDLWDTDHRLAFSEKMGEMLYIGENAAAAAHVEREAEYPAVDDDGRDPRRLFQVIADLLGVSPTRIMRQDEEITSDRGKVTVRSVVVDDPAATVSDDLAFEVLDAWVEREDLDIYSLVTPGERLTYRTALDKATLVDRASGEQTILKLRRR